MAQKLVVCPYCGCGCSFYLVTKNGRATGIVPSNNHPVSRGALCIKGWNSFEIINHPDRLDTPMVRDHGIIRPALWEEALDMAANGLMSIKNRYGGDAIGFFASAKVSNEENYIFAKMARAAFNTNNVDHCARLCHSSTVAGMAASFGSGAMTNSIDEFEDASVFMVIGSNTTSNHPLISSRIINAVKQRGAKLILCDPRCIDLAPLSSIHIRHKIGSDVALINGFMNIIINKGLEDKTFIEERTENFEKMAEVVKKYTPDYVSGITGVEPELLVKAAELYASTKRSMIVYAMGITQHITGTDNVKSCANLAMLTGNIGTPSSGVNPLRGQNNVQGACDMGGLPSVYSGYQPAADLFVRNKFEKLWGVDKLPEKKGLTVIEMGHEIEKGNIKALYIMGENPFISDPDAKHMHRALKKLELLIVQDIFPTPTSEFAHVILPAACFAEKSGTYTNTERRVQLSHQALPPLKGTLPDWKIICEISKRAGFPMDYNDPSEIMDEINIATPSYAGITYERLEQGWGIPWPCPSKEHPGTKFLHKDKFTRGRGLFHAIEYIPPAELPDAEYPFTLTTGRIRPHFHTGTMTRRTAILDREAPNPFLDINPEDAKSLRVRTGDKIIVESRRGSLKLPVNVTSNVPKGVVFSTFHFKEKNINDLTLCAVDPVAGIPEYKNCAVSIRRS